MIIISSIIFLFCTWAVFSKHFCDGVVAKNLLVFSAIISALAIRDPSNKDALISSALLLIIGLAYWYCRRHRCLRKKIS